MTDASSIPQERKLNVVYRVEAGCLGPTGPDLVDDFCKFARQKFSTHDSQFVDWTVTPRHDKSIAELEYRVNNKILNRDQASRYLQMFDESIDEFERYIEEHLVEYIDDFMDHD